MPGTDGLTATRQIRGFDPAAQIVVVTDYPDEDIKAAALDAGLAPTSSSRKWTAPRSPVFAGRCGRQSLLRRSPKFHHHRSSPAGYRFHRQLTAKQFGALPMPVRPNPPPGVLELRSEEENPTPLSSIVSVMPLPFFCARTVTVPACECFMMFPSDSCTMR